MTNRIRTGLFLGAVTAVIGGLSGCSGGTNRTDSAVPPVNLTRSVAGVWTRFQIGFSGTRVTCPDPADRLAPATRELTVNNVVVDTCASDESLILGTATSLGKGRYRLATRRGVEDGNYTLDGSTLTLVRDTINGASLSSLTPPLAPQRTVYAVSFDDTAGTITMTPVAQHVALKKVNTTQPIFRENGTLIVENVTPVLNSDGTVNTIVLTGLDDDTVVNADLSITIGPLATSSSSSETPGFTRVRAVTNTFKFSPTGTATPAPAPTPTPKPSGS